MVFERRDLSKIFAPPNKLRKLKNGNFPVTATGHRAAESSNVNVFVRVRPPNEKETNDNYRTVVKVIDEKLLVFDPQEEQEPFFFHGTRQRMRDIAKKQNKKLEFLFDGVFGPDVSNWDIHCKTTHNIIGSLLEGYNCSVFVYGATGAGKTFTMLGKSDQCPGIMYHTMAELYQQISSISKEKKCDVGVSFVEVYNENVFDLLHPSGGPLYLREDASGVSIVGLKVENISNADQLLQKLAQGNNNRTQHPTDANAESSRSHAVFQVYVRMVALDNNQVKIAKLSMIDLAGSERGMATGCKGQRFKEGSNINKSLLALGNCISSLAENLRHVPYRDSKLTRLLKDSLGGNCRTVMIANVSPSSASYEDTYNTLKFATRARKITSKLTKNILSSDMGVSHYMKLVDKLETENTLLKSKVRALEKTATDSARAYSQSPDISVWCSHLDDIFNEKIILCQRFLKVKSEAHLLEWRIKNKNLMKNILEKSCQNPYSNKTVGRLDLSVGKFESSLQALKRCVDDINLKLKNNCDKLTKLFSEMEEARVLQFMKKDIEHKNILLHSTIQEATNKYLMRLLFLQQKRAESCEAALDVNVPLLNHHHMLITGLNMVTNDMASEYNKAMSSLTGIKAVSWCDGGTEEMDTPLSSANAQAALNLSFDNSLFFIDAHNHSLKLEPTTLPIMDIKEDINDNEPLAIELVTNEEIKNETDCKSKQENNEVITTCENETAIEEDDDDTANSTITLDMPSVPLLIDAAEKVTKSTPYPTANSQTSQLEKLNNFNETVTFDVVSLPVTDDLPSIALVEEDKNNEVNSTFVKAKKSDVVNLSNSLLKKPNSGPLQRSKKENTMDLKKIDVEKFKENNCFKLPITKASSINQFQKHLERMSSIRRPLKPVNATITSGAAATPIVKPQDSISFN